MKSILIAAMFLVHGCATAPVSVDPQPLARAHAHNDYAHDRALLDALDNGFCNVEADIFLWDDQLLVGHTILDIRKDRTLQSLYLDPLRNRIKQNGGKVFRNGPPFTLMIDVKTDAAKTYAVLHTILEQYAGILTSHTAGQVKQGAVNIVISCGRDRATTSAQNLRYAAIDGRPSDLDGAASPSLIPWISDSWSAHFKWRGAGAFPVDEKEKLRAFVLKAHQQNRLLRFWGAPDNKQTWQELFDAGVDLINTDDLTGLARFFASMRK